MGAKVPDSKSSCERKFHRRTFVPGSESSREQNGLGAKVPGNERARDRSCRERKGPGVKVLWSELARVLLELSLPAANWPRSEKARYPATSAVTDSPCPLSSQDIGSTTVSNGYKPCAVYTGHTPSENGAVRVNVLTVDELL